MNVEYVRLADGNTAVTNEKGKIEIRSDKVSKNELVAENKITIMDTNIKRIKNKLNNEKGIVSLSKQMLIAQPLIFGACIFGGVISGSILACAVAGTIMCGTTALIYSATLPLAKEKLNGYEKQLEKALELKTKFEDELKVEKAIIDERLETINKPVSLKSENEDALPSINRDLLDAYQCGRTEKEKKKIKRH